MACIVTIMKIMLSESEGAEWISISKTFAQYYGKRNLWKPRRISTVVVFFYFWLCELDQGTWRPVKSEYLQNANKYLTHCSQDEMPAILQNAFTNSVSCLNTVLVWFKVNWNMSSMAQQT